MERIKGILLAAVIAVSGTAWAQEAAKPGDARGDLVAVDAAAGVLTIKTTAGAEAKAKLSPATEILLVEAGAKSLEGAERVTLSEVKLGIIPAMISPYVIAAIGQRMAHRYMLSGEELDAAEAYRIGLVHDICPLEELDGRINELLGRLLMVGPRAQAEAKALIRAVAARSIDNEVIADTAARIARVRGSAEGREGMAAFLEKRAASWIPEALRDS